MIFGSRHSLLRPRDDPRRNRVTNVELFFDLVFVFAVTQLSHALLHHFTLAGAGQAAVLFVAVWSVWIYTVWVTNWLDPDQGPVRILLFLMMAGALILSAALPAAFEGRGYVFAVAYVAMQLGRSLFMLWALRRHSAVNFRNYLRIILWLTLAAVFWLAGGFAAPEARIALWIVALLLEFVPALFGFWLPGLGRSLSTEWDVDGGHMAERCGAFILIALGESITIIGASFYALDWTPGIIAAFAVVCLGTAAMWWLYFDMAAEHGAETIAHARDPGQLASLAYHDMHALLVAGIILSAVADEIVIAEPHAVTDAGSAAVIIGGPALYLLGNLAFKGVLRRRPPLSHLVGLGLLALLCFGIGLPRSLLALLTALILIGVALWERISLQRKA